MNPLTAISNPNFSRKNTATLQRSNDDEDALNFGSQQLECKVSLRSLGSEVNLHNTSQDQTDNRDLRDRQSEEMKYP